LPKFEKSALPFFNYQISNYPIINLTNAAVIDALLNFSTAATAL